MNWLRAVAVVAIMLALGACSESESAWQKCMGHPAGSTEEAILRDACAGYDGAP